MVANLHICFELRFITSLKTLKNQTSNDISLKKMAYICSDFNDLKDKQNEKDYLDDCDVGMWHDNCLCSEACTD